MEQNFIIVSFKIFFKSRNIQHYSQLTNKGPDIAERVIRTTLNLLKEPMFMAENANWISELPTVIDQYDNTIHSSTETTHIQASKKSNEKEVYSNLHDRRVKKQPKFKLGQLVRTADTKKVFSKGDSTNYSYLIYTVTEIIHDIIPSYRINYLPERYNENPLLSTKLTLDENNKVMKKLNLIQ